MGSLLHRPEISIHHHEYAVRDITEGGRDLAGSMMKRRTMDEKTSIHRRERDIRCVLEPHVSSTQSLHLEKQQSLHSWRFAGNLATAAMCCTNPS